MAAVHVGILFFFFQRRTAKMRRASEASGCAALKPSGAAVRVSHGWDVPIHSLLESCLSMQLPIRPTPGLPILIWTT